MQATVASQVYRGLESATPRTQEAVDTTRSLVMVHGGKLINAVFHSSSGGATEPSGEVWRTQLPYLVSVPDHDAQSPVHRWTQTFDRRQLQAAFRDTDGLQAVDVLRTSSTGRLRSVRVRGPGGSVVLSGRELRQETWPQKHDGPFQLAGPGRRGSLSRPALQGGLPEGDRPLLIGALARFGQWLEHLASKPWPYPGLDPSAASTASACAGAWIACSAKRACAGSARPGFGHGVGMSQWGARRPGGARR